MRRRLVPLICVLAGVLAVSGLVGSAPAEAAGATCRAFPTIPVALHQGEPPRYHVWGELCATAAQARDGVTVQLLIPGATYGHVYWDFPYRPSLYSYARSEALAGYPTFTIDRIGTGNSSRPASEVVDLAADALVVHQIVQGLRNGSITRTRFGKVIIVGHSLGSVVTWREVATYHDVDGAIITGARHHTNPALADALATAFYPAQLDPRFASLGLDAGYLTTVPPPNGDPLEGVRARVFYDLTTADPAVIAVDEQTKETITTAEAQAAALTPAELETLTQQITVPVLAIIGQNDFTVCDAENPCDDSATLQRQEAATYPPQACVQALSVPATGHDISLHPTATFQVYAARAWADRFIGRTRDTPPAPGACTLR